MPADSWFDGWLPEWKVNWPALEVAPAWIERHCIVPDGFDRGNMFRLYPWQLWGTLNHYRVRRSARAGQLATAFHNRRSQVVLPQKAGKAPYTATHICLEGVGPALFAGWASSGDKYRCVDGGCTCGWVYPYRVGEPMGMPWPTPLIQITATSEEQTDNIYDALRPMIEYGPLAGLIPKTGEEFIRLPGGGRVDVVTSNATSRLGQRVTFVPQDETGLWTKQNKMVKVAETQRRGLAGMGGRAEETTNAWDPSEESVAQRTAAAAEKSDDIFRLHIQAPRQLSYANKRERRKIHEHVYAGSLHIDLDGIGAEAAELYDVDPPQAERFFGNRVKAGHGRAVEPDRWDELVDGREVPWGAYIGVGFDGSVSEDATVLRGCTRDGHSFLIGKWVRPLGPAGQGWRVPRGDVHEAVALTFERYQVGRFLADPPKWYSEIDEWQRLYGDDVVLAFDTNSDLRMGRAVDRWLTDIRTGAHTHDGDPTTSEHVKNAHKRKARAKDPDDDTRTLYTLVKGDDGGKIDAAVADVLAVEAAQTMPEEPPRVEPMVMFG